MKSVYRKRFKKGASTVSGCVFTVSWDRFKNTLEERNGKRLGPIISLRADEEGLHIFTEGGDISGWNPIF